MNETSPISKTKGFIHRPSCPCCGAGADEAKPVAWSQPRAEDIAPADHGRFLSGYTSRRVYFTYVQCPACGMVYCPTYYDAQMLADLYAHQPENMAEAPFGARLKTQVEYATLLPDDVPAGGDFLEVGPDIGLFAEACAARWNFNRFVLYEPNVDVHQSLSARLAGHELDIRDSLFSPGDIESGTVSLAAFIHVLDHIVDPVSILSGLLDRMMPGGVLFIVTHDVGSLLARVLGHRFPPFTLQHPHLFSGKSMTSMLEASGFNDVSVHKSVNYFPLTHLAQAGLSVLGVKKRILPNWPKPSLGLRLGNIATTAKRPRTIA